MQQNKILSEFFNLIETNQFFNDIIKSKNFFDIIKSNERTYTALLSWLFDAKESHQFKNEFLNEFINQINSKSRKKIRLLTSIFNMIMVNCYEIQQIK